MPLVRNLRQQGINIDLQDRFIDESELPGLFANHSTILLPYTSDFVAQSGVVFMALAYELPVIASQAGGLAELMSEFGIGLTFHPQTAEALAKAVRQLHEHPDSSSFTQEIRAAREKYSWAASARATLGGYRSVLQMKLNVEPHDCVVETTTA
jgi:glycosyltransferase involved in cell wall biosynthesis